MPDVSYSLVLLPPRHIDFLFFFFNDTATTEIYTLSLHDALPISRGRQCDDGIRRLGDPRSVALLETYVALFCTVRDRKSTRLNSSHGYISYAVFCLKKKKPDDLGVLH